MTEAEPAPRAIDLETAEELAKRLAAAVSTQRIYAPDHGRTIATLESFLAPLRRLAAARGDGAEPFVLHCQAGLLLHASVPLGTEDSLFGQLAQALEQRGYTGLSLQPGVPYHSVRALVSWLSQRLAHPLARELEGVVLLTDQDGEGGVGGGEPSASGIADFRIPEQIQLTSQQVLERARRSVELGRGIDFKEILELTQWVADVAIEKGNLLVAPTQLCCHDLYTFHHSVNVFLVSTALLAPFARDREELAVYAQAALLHDVGKARVPYEILHKRGRLTEDEFEVIRQHPVHGAEILLEAGTAHPLSVEVAYTHHMRADGHGYPSASRGVWPGPVSRVIQVSDMFEALTAHRPYKRGHSAAKAVDIILDTPGMEHQRPICALLLDRLTNSPPGSEVVLETGERAIVLRTHEDAPDRPVVRVVEDVDGERLEHPVEVDLRELPGDQPIRTVCLKPVLARPARAVISGEEPASAAELAQDEPVEVPL